MLIADRSADTAIEVIRLRNTRLGRVCISTSVWMLQPGNISRSSYYYYCYYFLYLQVQNFIFMSILYAYLSPNQREIHGSQEKENPDPEARKQPQGPPSCTYPPLKYWV